MRKRYYVYGDTLSLRGTLLWFNCEKVFDNSSYSSFVVTRTFQHAYRQWRRTKIRDGYSQIDVRGDRRKKPYVLLAYRYKVKDLEGQC